MSIKNAIFCILHSTSVRKLKLIKDKMINRMIPLKLEEENNKKRYNIYED